LTRRYYLDSLHHNLTRNILFETSKLSLVTYHTYLDKATTVDSTNINMRFSVITLLTAAAAVVAQDTVSVTAGGECEPHGDHW
jgi:hypothetical protein